MKVGAGGIDGHLFRLFQLVEVGDGGAVRDLPLTIYGPAVKKHGLAQRRLSFAAVTDDCNVTNTFSDNAHIKCPPDLDFDFCYQEMITATIIIHLAVFFKRVLKNFLKNF